MVYGDTDSVFVHLPGKSRADAFRIGREIASAVTAVNPSPVVLQFEKVYHPCVLLSKKRYVGYKYEHPAATKPVYDAKGLFFVLFRLLLHFSFGQFVFPSSLSLSLDSFIFSRSYFFSPTLFHFNCSLQA